MRHNYCHLDDPVDKAAALGRDVRIRCWDKACAHEAIRPASELAELCTARGWDRTLMGIGRHLRCSACGKRYPTLIVLQTPMGEAV